MNRQAPRRRPPPAFVWLLLSIATAMTLALLAIASLVWQRDRQVRALQAEVATLQSQQQATESQLAAIRGTATALESRYQRQAAALKANDPAQQLAALQAAIEAADDAAPWAPQLADLRASLAEVQTRVSGFQATLDDLAARLEALEPAAATSASPPLPSTVRLTVARQKQSHNLSCESAAAAMAAQYHGAPLSEAEALAALPRNDNPHLGFRGDVDGPTGSLEDYGVYAGPILALLHDRGLRAWRVAGGLPGIKAAIARGNPVIAWVTYNCQPGAPTTLTIDDQPVTLVPYQHAVVVTGYNAEGVWANDPWDGQEDFYPTADFERALGYFGDMAIEVAAP